MKGELTIEQRDMNKFFSSQIFFNFHNVENNQVVIEIIVENVWRTSPELPGRLPWSQQKTAHVDEWT